MSKGRRKKHASKRKRDNARALLERLAGALNACEKAGLRMRLDWAAWCHQGVVLPPQKKGQAWEARPFGVLPQSPPESGAEED